MKKTFWFLLALIGLAAGVYADQPGPVIWSYVKVPNAATYTWVAYLPATTFWLTDTLLAKDSTKFGWVDTLTVQIPVGVDYKGIYFVPTRIAGDSDSVNVTARPIGRKDLLACPAGTKFQNVPLVNATGTPCVWLNWVSGREYNSFVPDSNATTIEEFNPPACEMIQFIIRSGLVNADSLIYTFGVVFKQGGGM